MAYPFILYTAPNAIDQTVRQHQLNLTAPAPVPAAPATPADSPDAAE